MKAKNEFFGEGEEAQIEAPSTESEVSEIVFGIMCMYVCVS